MDAIPAILATLTANTTQRPNARYSQAFRYAMALSALVWLVLVQTLAPGETTVNLPAAWAVLAASVVYTLILEGVHRALARRQSIYRGLAYVVGFLVDTLFGCATVYVTGGVHSYYFLLCYFCMTDTALYFGTNGSLLVTTVGIALYVLTVLLAPYPITPYAAINLFVLVVLYFYFFPIYGGGIIESAKAQRSLNARLQEANDRIQRMLELNKGLNRTLDLQQVCARIGEAMLAGLKRPFAVTISLYDAEAKALRPVFALGAPLPAEADALHLEALAPDSPGPLQRLADGRLCASFPLVMRDEKLGVVGLRSLEDGPAPLGEEAVGLLSALADQSVASVKNALLYEEVRQQARTDGLTRVLNNRALMEKLEELLQLAARYGNPVSVLMLDIDLFKTFNDRHGHLCGDAVLQQVASALKSHLRQTDVVGRYGGEEFMVLLPHAAERDAGVVAEKIRQVVDRAAFAHESVQALHVTVSVGVATFAPGMTREQLVAHADEALYAAKHAGRNQVAHWPPRSAAAG